MAEAKHWRLRTGIRPLDVMLGYTGDNDGGLPAPGSIILLRGGPGSGKTTLGLQILSHHLCADSTHCAIFVSLEVAAGQAVEYAEKQFGMRLLTCPDPEAPDGISTRNRFKFISRDDLDQYMQLRRGAPAESPPQRPGQRPEIIHPPSPPRGFPEALGDFTVPKLKQGFEDWVPGAFKHPTLVLIDSINVLAEMVSHPSRTEADPKTPKSDEDRRAIIRHISTDLQRYFSKSIVLLTGEYHPDDRESRTISESFFCDTEILLAAEPIAGRATAATGGKPSLGYVIELGSPVATRKPLPRAIETRSFCRVLKSRTGPSQSRRCAYDLVAGKGAVFFETYPGDGHVALFAENAPQRQQWTEFFRRDLPHLYPALRYEQFDRSGLQRTFASRRRFLHIPRRTDVALYSFDTYWIRWFVQLRQRRGIAGFLDGVFLPTQRSTFPIVVGAAHRYCIECIEGGGEMNASGLLNSVKLAAAKTQVTLSRDQEKALQSAVDRIVNWMTSQESQSGLLRPIPQGQLRLFGERQSEFVPPLVRRTELPEPRAVGTGRNDEKKLLSVPYNANISLLVYRRDLLPTLRRFRGDALRREIRAEHEHLQARIATAFGKSCSSVSADTLGQIAERAHNLVSGEEGPPPNTWEEIIAICRMTGHKCLIETRTFDTVLCTLLEILWGCGGELIVQPDYSIDNEDDTRHKLVEAFLILHRMFEAGVIPRDCSLEPDYLGQHFSKPSGRSGDWIFARHWHSTLVDVLTRRRRGRRVWQSGPMSLEVTSLPRSLSALQQCPTEPCCTWGEWHLGLLEGSENEALGTDLINNLMSSQRICDRAFAGAALPTVQIFYEMYGDVRCFDFAVQDEVQLPSITYREIASLGRSAKSRSVIFDYRHCMRELHVVLQYVKTTRDADPVTILGKVNLALANIQKLGQQEVLLQ